MFKYGTENKAWANFSLVEGSGTAAIYRAEFDDSQDEGKQFDRIQFCRMNPSNATNSWEEGVGKPMWNWTVNTLNAPTVSGLLYTNKAGSIGNDPNLDISFYAYRNDPASFDDGGQYIFKNLGSGKYLAPDNDYSTQASLIVPTHYNTLRSTGDGRYKIESQVTNGDGCIYYNSGNGYMDSSDGGWMTIIKADDGNYNIFVSDQSTTGSTFIGYDGSSSVISRTLGDPANNNAKWQIISVADALNGATYDDPVNATYLIADADFGYKSRYLSSWNQTNVVHYGRWDAGGIGTYHYQNWNIQSYNTENFDIFQNLTVPVGVYELKCQGFYRAGDKGTTADTPLNALLYANSETSPLMSINDGASSGDGYTQRVGSTETYVPDSQHDCSVVFSTGVYSNNTVKVQVRNNVANNLKIGVKKNAKVSSDWACFDNFQLKYYGNSVAAYEPVAFTSGSAAIADTWNAFTVLSGGRYKITSSAAATIYYTQDNTVDADAGVSNVVLAADGYSCQTLKAGTYYFKSDAASTITITACTYSVSVTGTSITEGGYYNTNTLSTFTATISASTDDSDATLEVIGTPVATLTKGGSTTTSSTLTWDGTTLTATFSPAVNLTAEANDYNISIPAGAFGYAGHATNSAISIDFNTPVVFDGTYYLYDATNNVFLGKGANYGTRVVVDKYGVPFTWNNSTKYITFVDWPDKKMFFDNTNHSSCWLYADQDLGANVNSNITSLASAECEFAFETIDDKLYLCDGGKTVYINHDNSVLGVPTASSSGAAKWTVMTVAEHDAIVNAYPTDNKTSVITASGISTTAGSFDSYLSSNYSAVDKSISDASSSNAKSSEWGWTPTLRTNEGYPSYEDPYVSLLKNTGYYTYTIDKANLPAGIYKVEMSGFDRRKSASNEAALYSAYGNIGASYLRANNQQVQIKSSEEMFGDYAGDRSNWGNQKSYLSGESAKNVVYVYLDGSTDLDLKVEKPDYNPDGSCLVFGDFKLTYYKQVVTIDGTGSKGYTPMAGLANVTLNRALSADHWNTFCVPFAISNEELKTAFGDDVAVAEYSETAVGSNSTVTFTMMGEPAIAANKPVLLKPAVDGSTYSFTDRTIVVETPIVSGSGNYDFVGSYDAKTFVTTGNYYLWTDNKIYKSSSNNGTYINGTRAYIKDKTGAGARIISFAIDDEASGISQIEAEPQKANATYNLKGQKVSGKMGKGIYVVDGKKVVIK